jgi:O-acetyl-ADP-ribose deacetylase (regulator of RNase III)
METPDMIERIFKDFIISWEVGDIANQGDMDAIVNAANAELKPGGGVAGAIHRAAGPDLETECRHLAPISPGDAVITGAHKLPDRYVIHCLGPVYGQDEPADELLASCYRNALFLADRHGVTSIAFPAISTGAFGFPKEPAARIAWTTILKEMPTLAVVQHIRFALFELSDQQLYMWTFEELASASG